MDLARELVAVALIEKDTNGDILLTWAFPIVEEALGEILISRCLLQDGSTPPSHFSKFGDTWQYFVSNTAVRTDALPCVNSVSAVVLAKTFDPEKFGQFANVVCGVHVKTGNASQVMAAYLSAYTTGSTTPSTGLSFKAADFDPRRALLASSLKAIVKAFKDSAILLWVAIMLKKRIAVYGEDVPEVLQCVRSLPLLAWHRQDWSILRPFVNMSPPEIADLRAAVVYVAGFTDPAIKSHDDLWDVLVNIPERKVVVASHASASFVMGSIHKDVLSVLSDDSAEAQQLIKSLSKKTKEVMGNVSSCCTADAKGRAKISVRALENKRIPANLHQFLLDLALKEQLAQRE